MLWTLRARNATDAIRERWVGASWIIELVSTGRRDGKPFHHIHLFMDIQRTSRCDTTLRTSPKALLRLVRQRWAIENQWHWPRVCADNEVVRRPRGLTRDTRDTQLGEDAHRYSQRKGVQVLALLRTLALNLLRCNGFKSIRAGLMAVAHDIRAPRKFGVCSGKV